MPRPPSVPLAEARKRKAGKLDPAIALAKRTLEAQREALQLPDGVDGFIEDKAGRLFAYDGRCWRPVSDETVRAMLFRQAAVPDRCKSGEIFEALKQLRMRCHREAHQWGRLADHEVPCRNGVVDVRTMRLRAHCATDYIEAVIPHDFKATARSQALQDYLTGVFGDADEQRSAAAKAFAGYIVLPHARFKKALVLHGPSNTGKSEFVQLLKTLVGEDATCQLSVEDMADDGARAQLVGCLLNVMSELPADALIADGGFKALVSTEDPVSINPKYGHRFMYVPRAKHVIACNTLPRITDRTEATFNRLYLLPFDRVLSEDEQDETIRAKLADEMSGVLRWALDGARDLVKSGGRFPAVDMAASRLATMREEANPVAGFVRMMMVEEAGARTPVNEIAREFNAWEGGGRRLSVRDVGRMLRGAFGEECLAKSYIRALGATAQAFVGWRLRTINEKALVEYTQAWTGDDGPAPEAAPAS